MSGDGNIKCPSIEDLKSLSSELGLNISDKDMTSFKGHITKLIKEVYVELDKVPDFSLPVRYKFDKNRKPTPKENPLNAWVCLTDPVGPGVGKLAGKTLAIKDVVSMAGAQLEASSKILKGFKADINATVIDRIVDNGGKILGKSACEDLCFSGMSFSSVDGPVLNPHDRTRSAGGSSSGSAALIAAGEVDMAIGTDQGGSIRLPGSWCGVTGLKPTHGLVPYTGVSPMMAFMDHVGPMAKTVKDCALLLEVIAGSDGFDPRQPLCVPVKRYTEALTGQLKGVRIGLLKECFEGCEADVSDLVRRAASGLTSLGASVEEFSSSLHQQTFNLAVPIFLEGFMTVFFDGGITPLTSKGFQNVTIHDFLFSNAKQRINDLPIGLKCLFLHCKYIQQEYGRKFLAKGINTLGSVMQGYEELFKKYDAIIMPTIKYKAPKSSIYQTNVDEFLEEFMKNTKNTFPYDATGHPAVTVNAGYSEGLPVGLMVVGRHWEDDLILNVAYCVEQQRQK